MQEAFRECHGLQCGYCTPGMIMQAIDLLNENPNPSEEAIRTGLEGNLCRCTGYHNIVRAVQHAAQQTSISRGGGRRMTTTEDAAVSEGPARRSAATGAARRTSA